MKKTPSFILTDSSFPSSFILDPSFPECDGGTRRFERRGWGSTPHGDTDAGAARQAEHRTRNADGVGSSPTAGSDSMLKKGSDPFHEVRWIFQKQENR